jgi:hypothetical protein
LVHALHIAARNRRGEMAITVINKTHSATKRGRYMAADDRGQE